MYTNKSGMKLTDICGDCGSLDPAWAIVNRGILVCDECCSIHRSLGRHISQVKSLKRSPWSPSLLSMVQTLNNGGVNNLWEHSLGETKAKKKPTPKDPVHPSKADFIKAKHKDLQFVLKSGDTEEELNQQLHSSVRTPNLETSLRLLAQGADPNYFHQEKGTRVIHVAAKAGQLAQVELLVANGADPAARDVHGNSPSQCARLGGHREVQLRLTELAYEVTDRLLYFLCKRKPEHIQGQHFIIPDPNDCLVAPVAAPGNAFAKLKQLSNAQFQDLAMDVFDEVDRRETDTIWQSSGASLEHGSVPFLPVNPELSSMRNQGRQKLATLSPREFASLVLNILNDAKRRQSPTDRINGKVIARDSDDEPLYDSVASDEDYATAEQLAILVAQNARGMSLSISQAPTPAVGVESNARMGQLEQTPKVTVESELREQLTLSNARISQLHQQIRRLNTKVEEQSLENKQLKSQLQGQEHGVKGKVGSENSLFSGPGGATLTQHVSESEPTLNQSDPGGLGSNLSGSQSPSNTSRRPASMYETREAALRSQSLQGLPSEAEIERRVKEVTRNLQDLWTHARLGGQFGAAAEKTRVAISMLSQSFPQNPLDDTIRNALRQLNTGVVRLQADCANLDRSIEQLRTSIFSIAKANKLLASRLNY